VARQLGSFSAVMDSLDTIAIQLIVVHSRNA